MNHGTLNGMNEISQHGQHISGAGRASARLAGVFAALAAVALMLSSGCAGRPSAVQEITPPRIDAAQAGDAAILFDPVKHDILLTWVAGDSSGVRIWFARSADQGVNWTEPVPVTPIAEPLQLNAESSPRMVCDAEGRIGIAWATSVEVPGRRFPASDLRFSGSSDGGRTWGAPVTINDDSADGPGSHTFHALALRPSGGIYAAWLDSRPGGDSLTTDESEGPDASIHFARSDDHGAHWGKNLAQWSRVCPCCRVSLVVDPFGVPYTAFRKHYPGQIRDVVLARPGGEPVRLRVDNWEIDGCPHAGPPMVLSRDGSLRVAWFTGAEGRTGVYFRQILFETIDSTSTPVTVMASEELPTVHVDVGEAGMSGTLLAMDADSTGANQLTLARVESSGRRLVERFVVPGTRGASHPKVATTQAGKQAYVVWTARAGERRTLRMARWDIGR